MGRKMKIKAVIFDLELVGLLNGKDNMFNWFLQRGEDINGNFIPIKTVILENEVNDRKDRLPQNIKPDFIGSARIADEFLKAAGIEPENTMFVFDNEEPMESSKKCRPRYRAYDFDGLTRIVNLIEWKENE